METPEVLLMLARQGPERAVLTLRQQSEAVSALTQSTLGGWSIAARQEKAFLLRAREPGRRWARSDWRSLPGPRRSRGLSHQLRLRISRGDLLCPGPA